LGRPHTANTRSDSDSPRRSGFHPLSAPPFRKYPDGGAADPPDPIKERTREKVREKEREIKKSERGREIESKRERERERERERKR